VTPEDSGAIPEVLAGASARGVIARGLGRSYGDAAQNAGGRVLETGNLSGIEDFDMATGRVTALAGTSLEEIIGKFLPWGWFPSVVPGTKFVTIGGAIAADIHGKNHHVDGGFCDFVESFELVSEAGRRAAVTLESDPDAFRATAGGMGLTGVITRATVRLRRVHTSFLRADTYRADDIDQLMSLMESKDDRYSYSVAWLDSASRGKRLGRGIFSGANHAFEEELEGWTRTHPLETSQPQRFTIPPVVPSGVLGPATARVLNELWFRKSRRKDEGRILPLLSYFFPLDAVADWNRLYGPRGFVQYQFVVPFGQEAVVRRILEQISTSGCPSQLAVLKRFGRGRGLLSFPIPGWTLALDFPAGNPRLPAMLDRFDEMVADAGGRIYLAKDSRLDPPVFRRMYPDFERWQEIREGLDPDHLLRSDLDRRLNLVGRSSLLSRPLSRRGEGRST
jgi:decaprenylphospho-beta-D-ribofuranose 2-oxidase